VPLSVTSGPEKCSEELASARTAPVRGRHNTERQRQETSRASQQRLPGQRTEDDPREQLDRTDPAESVMTLSLRLFPVRAYTRPV